MASRTELPEWKALNAHTHEVASRHLRDLFAEDSTRVDLLTLDGAGLTVDLSKNRISAETSNLLNALARACDLERWRDRMAAGEAINLTEGRAALHMALRGGVDVHRQDVLTTRSAMLNFVDQVQSSEIKGATGKPLRHVVNIGIGGSDLGPRLAADALRADWTGHVTPHFVANVDATELLRVLEHVNAEETLIVIASKTFTTQETMRNAQTARAWLQSQLPTGADISSHFAAVTTNIDAATAFGVNDVAIFGFWDWVGGRYSVWSSVGLSLALAIGRDGFEAFLAGAVEMDQHFLTAPMDANLPMQLALIGVWNRTFLGLEGHAVLPYDQSLALLPGYLQQLDMESNGKSVTREGTAVDYQTGPLVFGSAGSTGQHSFYQWLHQGTALASADILLTLHPRHAEVAHHNILLAHGIAQGEAFAFGRDEAATRAEMEADGLAPDEIEHLLPHRTFAGNRPISTIVIDRLCPRRLGALLAMYEHKVFSQGVIWNINSFDQWGVELGKSLANRVLTAIEKGGAVSGFDASTRALIARVPGLRVTDKQ